MTRGWAIAVLLLTLAGRSEAVATPADDAARGKIEFEAGARAFQADRYAEALPHFQAAYALSGHRPAAVFALAQCERALDLYDEAIAHFEEFLASSPDPERVAEIRTRIAQLSELRSQAQSKAMAVPALGKAAGAPGEAPAAPGAESLQGSDLVERGSTPAPPSRLLPYATIGVGAGLVATGVALWIVAAGRASDLDGRLATKDGAPILGISHAEARSEADAIEAGRGVALAIGAAGAGAALAGILWLQLGFPEEAPAIALGPTGGGVVWSRAW